MTVILIMGLTATYTVFLYSKNILLENEKESLIIIASEHAQQIAAVLKQSTDLSEIFSQQDFVVNYLNNEERELQDEEVLSRFEAYNIGDNYSSIYLLDQEGTTLVSTDKSFVSNNYSFRDYFKKAILGGKYTDISVGITSKELGYYFSAPIKDKNNKIIGVVVLKMKPTIIDDLIINPYLKTSHDKLGLLAVIDDYSVIFHSNDKSKLFKSVAYLNSEILLEISEKKRFADYKIDPLDYEIDLAEIRTMDNSLFKNILSNTSNDSFLMDIVQIEGYPFNLVIIKNESELISEAVSISRTLGFFVLFSAILALIIINFLIGRHLKPLSELNKIVIKATEGDLGQRVLVDSKDEIGILGKNFNKLIEKLHKTLINIEKKINQRTEQLEKTNKSMVGREMKMIELKKKLEQKEKNED